MEEIVKQYGFESVGEFHRMVADVDLTSAEKIAAFKKWQEDDGTKKGLIALKKRQQMLIEFKETIKEVAEICDVSESEQETLFEILFKNKKLC